MEVWRAVIGYEGFYEVSDAGRVRRIAPYRSTRAGKVLKLNASRGYLHCALSRQDKPKTYCVHRLVAAAFIGPRPEGKVINHRDGKKANNAAGNLEYITGAENDRHASRLGLKAFGERNPARLYPERLCRGERQWASKLSEADVREIRQSLASGAGTRATARRYGINSKTVCDIKYRRIWKHVG